MTKHWFMLNADKQIVNIIAADSKEIAEQITGLIAMEVTPDLGGSVGDIFIESHNKFKPMFPPYAGWIFDEELWRYEPPIAYPDDEIDYVWDNLTVSWVPADSNS